LALGLPVIASPIAAEGMGLEAGIDLIVSESPQEFANQIIGIYESEEMWHELSKNGLKAAKNKWGSRQALLKMRSEVLEAHGFSFDDSAPEHLQLYKPIIY